MTYLRLTKPCSNFLASMIKATRASVTEGCYGIAIRLVGDVGFVVQAFEGFGLLGCLRVLLLVLLGFVRAFGFRR